MIERGDGHSAAQRVADALSRASRVTAICHQNPDADTIGAAVAIALVARRLGAASEVVSVDGLPGSCAFLPLVDQVHRRPQLEPDLAVVCDAATLDRVGSITTEAAAWLERAQLVNIDHHVTNSAWGGLNLVDPAAAATCEVIADLLPLLGIEPDPEIATALLTGIVRDSQGFSDGATSPRTLRVAAGLMEAGASLPDVQRRILHEMPYSTLALWGRILGGVGERLDGQVVHATLTLEMLRETSTAQHDADGSVEFMARARGALVTLLFRELGPGATRVSVRTTEGVDATDVARAFGGGGHARRAGFIVEQWVEQTRADVLAACEGLLKSGAATPR